MEFTNEIYFNKNLVQNETVLISYAGKLFKEHSAEITIVYGFGDNWEHTSESKMRETENGFETLITLENYNTFNFCFKNSYNIWDNNCGCNYIASISPAEEKQSNTENIITETNEKVEENTEIQSVDIEINTTPNEENSNNTDNQIIETENNIETIENSNEEVQKEETAPINNNEVNNTENYTENFETTEITESLKNAKAEAADEIGKAFDALLDSILEFKPEEKINIDLENGFGLQSIDEINETDSSNNTLSTELEKIETTQTEESQKNTDKNLENLLNSFTVKQEKSNDIMDSKELNNLMDNVLNSIIEEENKTTTKILNDDSSLYEATEQQSEIKIEEYNADEFELINSNLPAIKYEDDFFDKCIDASYSFCKKVWNGIKKFGIILKRTAQDLIGEKE